MPLPRRVWIEFHAEDGTLLATVDSEIDGATFITPLPAFEPGTRGTLTMCGETVDGRIWRDSPSELQDLPDASGVIQIVETG